MTDSKTLEVLLSIENLLIICGSSDTLLTMQKNRYHAFQRIAAKRRIHRLADLAVRNLVTSELNLTAYQIADILTEHSALGRDFPAELGAELQEEQLALNRSNRAMRLSRNLSSRRRTYQEVDLFSGDRRPSERRFLGFVDLAIQHLDAHSTNDCAWQIAHRLTECSMPRRDYKIEMRAELEQERRILEQRRLYLVKHSKQPRFSSSLGGPFIPPGAPSFEVLGSAAVR